MSKYKKNDESSNVKIRLKQRIVNQSTSKCSANNCKDICNQLRNNRINDVEKTIANKDNLIRMLQDQLKKMESLYKQHLDESEQIRLKYRLASDELEKLKRNYQQSLERFHREKSQTDQKQNENGIKSVMDEISEFKKQFQQFIQKVQSSFQNQLQIENRLNSLSNMIKEQNAILQTLVQKSTMNSMNSKISKNNQTERKNGIYESSNRKSERINENQSNSLHKENSELNRKLTHSQTEYEVDYSRNKRQISFDRNAATNTNAQVMDRNTIVEKKKMEKRVQASSDEVTKFSESSQDQQEITNNQTDFQTQQMKNHKNGTFESSNRKTERINEQHNNALLEAKDSIYKSLHKEHSELKRKLANSQTEDGVDSSGNDIQIKFNRNAATNTNAQIVDDTTTIENKNLANQDQVLSDKVTKLLKSSKDHQESTDNQTSFQTQQMKNHKNGSFESSNRKSEIINEQHNNALLEAKDSIYKSLHKENSELKRKIAHSQTEEEVDSSGNERQIKFDRNAATSTNAQVVDKATTTDNKNLENRVQALSDEVTKLYESSQDHQEATTKKLQNNRQMMEDLIQENIKLQKNVISIKATLGQILNKINDKNSKIPQENSRQGSDKDSVATVDLFKQKLSQKLENKSTNNKGDNISQRSERSNKTPKEKFRQGSDEESVATVDLFKQELENKLTNNKGDSTSYRSEHSNKIPQEKFGQGSDEDSVATVDVFKQELENKSTINKGDNTSRRSEQSNKTYSIRNQSEKKDVASVSTQSDDNVLFTAYFDSNSQTEDHLIIRIRSAQDGDIEELEEEDSLGPTEYSSQYRKVEKVDDTEERDTIEKSENSSNKSEPESNKSYGSKPLRNTPSKKQLEDSFKMLREHYNDLQNERTQKDKQITWMEELITYFTDVMNDDIWDNIEADNGGNLSGVCDGTCVLPKDKGENLKYYIEKVENENTKLKSTINSIVQHLKETILEISSKPKSSTTYYCKEPENYNSVCRCGLEQEEERIIETCIEECLNLTSSGDSTAMISNLEKYINYLQDQLEVTAKIEEEIEDLRKDIEDRQN